jgi:hypothetical protein
LGEGQEDGNGSIERGKLGHLLPWRARGGLGPYYLLVLVIARRRAHLWRRAHTHLAVGVLVLSQICLVHGGRDTQQVVCVEGILHWAKEEGGRITSMDRATREEGALSLGAFLFLELQSFSRGVAIVLAYLVYSLLEIIIIYTFIPNWFSPGGFYPGSC